MRKYIIIGITLVLLTGAGIYLASRKAPEPATSQFPVEPGIEETIVTEEGVEINIEGDDYKYSPSSISLEKDQKVKLTFTNVGQTMHDLVIDDLGVKTALIAPEQSQTVEFVADKTGVFTFYCSVGNHKDLGMKGSMEIK